MRAALNLARNGRVGDVALVTIDPISPYDCRRDTLTSCGKFPSDFSKEEILTFLASRLEGWAHFYESYSRISSGAAPLGSIRSNELYSTHSSIQTAPEVWSAFRTILLAQASRLPALASPTTVQVPGGI